MWRNKLQVIGLSSTRTLEVVHYEAEFEISQGSLHSSHSRILYSHAAADTSQGMTGVCMKHRVSLNETSLSHS